MDAAEATERLFDLYRHDVYRYARFTLGDPSDAEDVVQDVFIRVLRNWDRYRGDAAPKTWLWTIVRSSIADAARRRKRQTRRDLAAASTFEEAAEPTDVPLEIEEALRELPQAYREVVVLRLLQDWSTGECATMLGWSESKVKTTLHRAVAKLRRHLSEEGPGDIGSDGGDAHGLR